MPREPLRHQPQRGQRLLLRRLPRRHRRWQRALLAAKWLAQKPAGLYSMECIVRDNLREALRAG